MSKLIPIVRSLSSRVASPCLRNGPSHLIHSSLQALPSAFAVSTKSFSLLESLSSSSSFSSICRMTSTRSPLIRYAHSAAGGESASSKMEPNKPAAAAADETSQAAQPESSVHRHPQAHSHPYAHSHSHSHSHSHHHHPQPLTKRAKRRRFYKKMLKWTVVGLAAGAVFITYEHYKHLVEYEERKRFGEDIPHAPDLWIITLFKKLPTRAFSRAWGTIHYMELPVWMREPFYELYSKMFGCNLEEMANPDLSAYPNLSAFFMRQLKPGVRPISDAPLISPADGKILHFGVVDEDRIEQVKDVTYSLKGFLGETPKTDKADNTGHSHAGDAKKLYHMIIYLAPGDYHRFHAPAEWVASKAKHFHGELFSVAPAIAEMIAGLFSYNERVVLLGKWKHGFFSYSAVGAYNVGSIIINCDPDLVTNASGPYLRNSSYERQIGNVKYNKGDEVGAFNLGSTIVLIFEAPSNFKFVAEAGQRVKLGEPLGVFEYKK